MRTARLNRSPQLNGTPPVCTFMLVRVLRCRMGCFHCNDGIEKETGYFELHHHQAGSDAILQHTFCSSECLREYVST